MELWEILMDYLINSYKIITSHIVASFDLLLTLEIISLLLIKKNIFMVS